MNSEKKTDKTDLKVLLSTLWIVVMFNMGFADILGLFEPGILKQIMTGSVDDIHFTSGLMLVMAIMLEIPIAMILLSRVLKFKANRWVNIIAGVITIVFIIGGGSTTLSYMFFATIEVVCILFIIWYAWKWHNTEDSPNNKNLTI